MENWPIDYQTFLFVLLLISPSNGHMGKISAIFFSVMCNAQRENGCLDVRAIDAIDRADGIVGREFIRQNASHSDDTLLCHWIAQSVRRISTDAESNHVSIKAH